MEARLNEAYKSSCCTCYLNCNSYESKDTQVTEIKPNETNTAPPCAGLHHVTSLQGSPCMTE